MTVSAADMARRVREALATPRDGPLAAKLAAPLVTALVADAAEGPWLEPALAAVSETLSTIGVPRGRQFVLLGSTEASGEPLARARAAALRRSLAMQVFAHDPSGAWFTAARFPDGTAIELDDELREAEAIVTVGLGSAGAGSVRGGPWLLLPGVASLATRRALARARAAGGEPAALALSLAAERAVPVDLALSWDEAGVATAASGRASFAALASAAGLTLPEPAS